MPRLRSFWTASGGVPKLPPAITRSALSATIFSTSTTTAEPSNFSTSGIEPASGG